MANRRASKAPAPARPVEELGPETRITQDLADWLNGLLRRADAGDAEAHRQLVAAYDAVPRLWDCTSGLYANAERSWLDLVCPPGALFARTATEREVARLRRELAGPAPSPLERLLVDRIVVCWLQATYAETKHAQRLTDGMTFKEAEFHQRRSERAQRQLLRAVQALATVRRLLGPVVQVNVADQQINIAGAP